MDPLRWPEEFLAVLSRMLAFPYWPFTLVAGYLALGTIALKMRISMRRTPTSESRHRDELSPQALAYFDAAANGLAAMGCSFGGFSSSTNINVNRAFEAAFADETSGAGVALAVFHQDSGLLHRVTILRTRFEDGFVLATTNTRVAGFLRPVPRVAYFRFPSMASAPELLEAHRCLVRAASGHGNVVRIAADRAVVESHEAGAAAFAHNVEVGVLFVDGDRVRPTWKGAFFGTLKMSWPAGKIRAHLSTRRSLHALDAARTTLRSEAPTDGPP